MILPLGTFDSAALFFPLGQYHESSPKIAISLLEGGVYSPLSHPLESHSRREATRHTTTTTVTRLCLDPLVHRLFLSVEINLDEAESVTRESIWQNWEVAPSRNLIVIFAGFAQSGRRPVDIETVMYQDLSLQGPRAPTAASRVFFRDESNSDMLQSHESG